MLDRSVDLWALDEVHFQQQGSRCRMWVPLLAAAGEGATLAGQREPHRECSMAVSGDTRAWCREHAFRPSGGDFQGIGVYRSDGCLESAEATRLRAPVIVSMSPPGYPSAMVASLQCLLPFRPARSL
jgi:hypothetical protein